MKETKWHGIFGTKESVGKTRAPKEKRLGLYWSFHQAFFANLCLSSKIASAAELGKYVNSKIICTS